MSRKASRLHRILDVKQPKPQTLCGIELEEISLALGILPSSELRRVVIGDLPLQCISARSSEIISVYLAGSHAQITCNACSHICRRIFADVHTANKPKGSKNGKSEK